jgi:branched-chain amino acid transport system permease protein
MNQFVQVLLFGLTAGGVYALMASGLTLVFGVMKIVNIAHAAFMIIAAYIAFFAFTIYNIDPIISIVITMPVMFFVGLIVYKLFFAQIKGAARAGELTVLLTFALALIVEGILGYFFSNIYRSANPSYATQAIHLGPYILSEGQFYATLLSISLIILLWAFLKYSRTGYAIRATMQNISAAQVVGVNVENMSMIAFGIGMALAGASGSMMSFLFTFYPGRHWEWIAILLALIVLGGMGSLGGALAGAFILAITSNLVGNYLGPTWSPLTFFLALFIVLLVRPQGLFGKKMEA